MRRVLRRIAVLSVIPAALSCEAERAAPADTPVDVMLPEPTVLVSLESELIGMPNDLAIDRSGRIWVADGRSSSVLVLDTAGQLIRRIAREGEGPGELQSPMGLAVADTLVRVIDSGNMRLQDYRPDGSHVADHTIASAMLAISAASLDGRLISPTMGLDSALAVVRVPGDSGSVRLGPPVAPPPPGFHLSAMKAVIAEGGVPDEFRNQVTPVPGSDGNVWLLVQTESEIRKYARDGSLLWTAGMQVPEVEAARREFMRRNVEETNPSRIFPLLTMASGGEVVGDLWVVMTGEAGAPTVLYVLDGRTGVRKARLTVPTPAPAGQFAVDVERKRMYLAIPEEASILAVDLSGAEALLQSGR